ncbi:MAG: hypothetical protein U0797_30315 [Gemmataceae bacterium]
MSTVAIREAVRQAASTLRVDRQAGRLRGVKLLGWESANSRRYRPEGVDPQLYVGKPINIGHHYGRGDRPITDRIGVVESAERRRNGIFGVVKFFLSHPYTPAVLEMAEVAPHVIGFSHSARGTEVRTPSGGSEISKLESVASCDLVTDPATVAGLFSESRSSASRGGSSGRGAGGGWAPARQRSLAESVAAINGPPTFDDDVRRARRRRLVREVAERLRVNDNVSAARSLTEMAEAGLLGDDDAGFAQSGIGDPAASASPEDRARARIRKAVLKILADKGTDLGRAAELIADVFANPPEGDDDDADDASAKGSSAAEESRRGPFLSVEVMRTQAGLTPRHIAVARQLREASRARERLQESVRPMDVASIAARIMGGR